jgi:tRNA modification GTPase
METLLACLTPPGKAAIATLGVRGPTAWAITRQLFQPAKGVLPEEPTEGKYWHGKLGQDHADQVILAVKQTSLELHCHGGVEVVRMLQELYAERGVAIVPWQQFFDGPTKLYDMLAHAPTTCTAGILLDQNRGAWQRCVRELLDARRRGETAAVKQKLVRLEALIPLGEHLIEPWKVAIAGAPNVGKSSLMNALAGYTRSIVSAIPGTTRDVVTTRLAIDGWPIEMTDTAGIRETASALEQQGINRTRDALRESALRFWLLDGSTEPIFPAAAAGWRFLINKIDLPVAWDCQRVPEALRISAQTHAGLAELCEVISRELVPLPPEPGEAVPCLPEQVEWIREASR